MDFNGDIGTPPTQIKMMTTREKELTNLPGSLNKLKETQQVED